MEELNEFFQQTTRLEMVSLARPQSQPSEELSESDVLAEAMKPAQESQEFLRRFFAAGIYGI